MIVSVAVAAGAVTLISGLLSFEIKTTAVIATMLRITQPTTRIDKMDKIIFFDISTFEQFNIDNSTGICFHPGRN
jgi:hypothetical protein